MRAERIEGELWQAPPTALTSPSIPRPCYNPAMPFNRAQARQAIEHRNRLRASAHLPVLDIEAELIRLEQVQRETAFERFVDSSELYCRTMRRGVYRKRTRDNGNFNSIDGMALQACIRRMMAKRFDRL